MKKLRSYHKGVDPAGPRFWTLFCHFFLKRFVFHSKGETIFRQPSAQHARRVNLVILAYSTGTLKVSARLARPRLGLTRGSDLRLMPLLSSFEDPPRTPDQGQIRHVSTSKQYLYHSCCYGTYVLHLPGVMYTVIIYDTSASYTYRYLL